MRTCKVILVILFVLMTALTCFSHFYRQESVDDTPPVLTCTEEVLEVSVNASQGELLRGITAWDDRDGDLTGEIMVDHISTLISANTAKITYVVFDHADNASKLTRTVAYTDYEAPKFSLSQPLIFDVGKTVTLMDRLTAYDLVDGDLTGSIRMTVQNLNIAAASTYSITLQVTNSLGDTAIVPLSVIMRENGKLPSIALQEYLVYLKQGDRFDPESYLLRVTELIAGRERTCPLDEVSIDSKVDMDHPGVYEVTFQYTGEAGTGKTILTVVVE